MLQDTLVNSDHDIDHKEPGSFLTLLVLKRPKASHLSGSLLE